MLSMPKVSLVKTDRKPGYCLRHSEKSLRELVLKFVMKRASAIRRGKRKVIDATYDTFGIRQRDGHIANGNSEYLSYYDWYLNSIERGIDTEVLSIQIRRIELADLPFRHNVNWTVTQPELELRIRTQTAEVSWYVKIQDDRELFVVIPSMSSPPWQEPIIETRGGKKEFNAKKFAKELAEYLAMPLWRWGSRLGGLVKIRAFAISLDPYYGTIQASLLTDHERFNEAEFGKWCMPDWRFHDIGDTHDGAWGRGENLSHVIKDFVRDRPGTWAHPKFDYWVQSKEDFEIVLAAVDALKAPGFLKLLNKLDLSKDFELGVFHIHDENHECNFARKENQNLKCLVKVDV